MELLEDYGFAPHLVHSLRCKAIASARLKNDKVDAAILAQLLRADLLLEAWIAPPAVRQLRALLRHRVALVRLRTLLRNRIHAVLAEHGHDRPVGCQSRLVIIGGETGGRWLGGIDRQLRAQLLSPFVSQKLGTFVASENAKDLMTLRELIEAGKVVPAIDRTYPLREVVPAIRYLLEGHARGKIVIKV